MRDPTTWTWASGAKACSQDHHEELTLGIDSRHISKSKRFDLKETKRSAGVAFL